MLGAIPGQIRQSPFSTTRSSISRPSTSASPPSRNHSQQCGTSRSNATISRASNRSMPRSSSQNAPLTRIATPAYSFGTATASGRRSRAASSLAGSEGNQVVCAVSEARGIGQTVGVAFINISTGEALLSQICDTQSYVRTIHKLKVFGPSRILIISTACPPNPKSNLRSTIEEELPWITIIPLDRKYWSETAGLEFIQALAFKQDIEAIRIAIQGNFYATSSFSAASLTECKHCPAS